MNAKPISLAGLFHRSHWWNCAFLFSLVLTLGLASCTSSEKSGGAFAGRISAQSQLIGGPKALGSIGDYILENDKIRVIVHGPGANRGTTMYPGMIIDADLQRPEGSNGRGFDQIGEITPAFLFETFNPTRFEVNADGSDGGPAIVSVHGVGDDFLGQLSILSTGLFFPQGLEFRIDYILHPGNSYIEIRSHIKNATDTIHPFPFLDPPALRDLGLDIPGLDELELSVPLGLFAIFGAENKVFAPGPTGFNLRFAVEDSYLSASGLPAFPGIVADYVATRANKVSYALTIPRAESNYVANYADQYPGQKVEEWSLLVPFLFSSVTAVFHSEAPQSLASGEEFEYSAYLAIGRGDVASAAEIVYDIHDIETGIFSGRIVDKQSKQGVTEAMVMLIDGDGNYLSQLDTDTQGAFHGKVPVGNYSYRVVAPGRHPSPPQDIDIRANQIASALFELDAPASLAISVQDEEGRDLPCKITLVGNFSESDTGRDPRDFLYDLALGESVRHTSFDPARNEFVEAAWYTADGNLQEEVRPGEYELHISRGNEYDSYVEQVELHSGKFLDRKITLSKSFETPGYIAADLHLHSQNSVDSDLPLDERVISIAGEGLEYVAATDHNFVTDYAPYIAAEGLTHWLLSSVGVEVTTFEMGHFNGYPLSLDSSSIRGGEVEWADQTPQSIFDQIRSLGKLGPENTIVQVNHPRWEFLGYFNVFNISQDSGEAEERSGLASVFAPSGQEYALGNFSLDFDVVEILNGKRVDLVHSYRVPDILPPPPLPENIPETGTILRNEDGSVAFPGAMEDWFVMLNRGIRFTGVGSSDSHEGLGEEPGFPRTYIYVGEDRDEPGQFTEKEVVAALRGGRASISMGPFVDFSVNGQPIGSMHTARDGQVELRFEVRAPNFAPAERLLVYANGDLIIDENIPQTEAFDYSAVARRQIDKDTWFLVEVRGSKNLFPIVTPSEFEPLSPDAVVQGLGASLDLSALNPFGNLKPSETSAISPLAFTNPIWVDVDGNGEFDPSFESGVKNSKKSQPNARPHTQDLRSLFNSIPEVRQ